MAAAKGYEQLSPDSLEAIVGELIEAFPEEWTRYQDCLLYTSRCV